MSDDHRREGQPLLEEYFSGDESSSSSVRLGNPVENSASINSDHHARGSSGEFAASPTKVYKRRWYILLIFSLFSCTYSAVWNCWGPISSACEAAFDWEDSTIAMLTNLGPIAYMFSGFIFPWLLQVKGLRWSLLISSLLSGVGNTLRSLSTDPKTATALIYMGQALNGIIGPMAMAAIPQVSSIWFPPDERVTATSISNSFCIFGYAISFLIGPALVSDVRGNSSHGNHSLGLYHTVPAFEMSPYDNTVENISLGKEETVFLGDSHVDENAVLKARREIIRYMYIECGWSWFLFVAMLVYFPAQPPLPPGRSAVVAREDYWGGLWSLKGKLGFLLVAFCYGISTGVTAGWASLLSVTLKDFNVHQSVSGWIGFYAITGSCVIALLVCRFADHFIRHIKIFIIVMYSLGTAALLVFAFISSQVIAFRIGLVYVVVIAGFTLTNGAIPLLFELACELAYPTSESAANGFLTFLNNLFCLLFLLVLSIPHVGVKWEHWAVTVCCFLCIPMIAVLKTRFNRLDLDELQQTIIVEVDYDDNDKANENEGFDDAKDNPDPNNTTIPSDNDTTAHLNNTTNDYGATKGLVI